MVISPICPNSVPSTALAGKAASSGTPASICERVVGWEQLEEQTHLSPSRGETGVGIWANLFPRIPVAGPLLGFG